jgi:hypothetical protein
MSSLRAPKVAVVVCALLTTSVAHAQFSLITRDGSPRTQDPNRQGQGQLATTLPIGIRDCMTENWTFRLNYASPGMSVTSLQLWVGADAMTCGNIASRSGTSQTCWQIAAPDATLSNPVLPNNSDVVIPARYLVDPLGGNCANPSTSRGTVNTNFVTLLANTTAGLTQSGMGQSVLFDLDPPVAATGVSAVGGESSLTVSWSYTGNGSTTTQTDAGSSGSVVGDLLGFWVLCDEPRSTTTDAGTEDAATGSDVPDQTFGDDAGVSTTCGAFPAIDPNNSELFNRYVRTSLLGTSTTRATVSNLVNGRGYRCAVVAEDNAGNRRISSATQCAVPAPVTDFWERYRADGGAARPTDCSARPGSVPLRVIDSFVFVALAVLMRRRRSPS